MATIRQIKTFITRLAAEVRPHRIILFGSRAYGRPNKDSDVDLLVILPFRGNSFDRATEILSRVRAEFPIDLIVQTPADAKRRYREFDPMIREALDRGKVLYEHNRKRMGSQSRRRLQYRHPRIAR